MGASGTPIFLAASVDEDGVTTSLGQEVSCVSINNMGPDAAQVSFGGATPFIMASGEFINLPRVGVSEVIAICSTGETAVIQIAAIPKGFVGFTLEESA